MNPLRTIVLKEQIFLFPEADFTNAEETDEAQR